MTEPPLPLDEQEREAALKSIALLDTPPEERFDRVTRLAAALLDVPIALVSLVDRDRQWFKSCLGLDTRETPRQFAFCAHAILGNNILEIPDATADGRFRDNPLVTGPPYIRFYAGVPLQDIDGYRVGTLCVIDTRPRRLDATQRERLTDLARVAESEVQRSRLREERLIAGWLRTLNRLAWGRYQSLDEQFEALMRAGCDAFGLETGIVSRIKGDTYEIRAIHSPLEAFRPGDCFSLEDTYCAAVVRRADAVGYSDVGSMEKMRDHPVYKTAALASYLGTPIWVDGAIYGTLNFSDRRPRRQPWTSTHLDFINQLALTIGRAIELSMHNQAREQAVAEMEETRQLYGLILETTAAGLCGLDTEGRTVFANAAACQMTGYRAEELVGRPQHELIHHSLADGTPFPAAECPIRGTIQDGRSVVEEDGLFWRKDGTAMPVVYKAMPMRDRDGRVVGAVVSFEDISAEQAAARELMRQRSLFETVFRHLPDALVLADPQRRILRTNPAASHLFGYTPEELEGCKTMLLYADQSVYMDRGAAQYHPDGYGESLTEVEYQRKDGSTFVGETMGSVIRDESGELIGYLGVIRDITQRREIERMKNEFIATVSHELRTPLTSIQGSLGLLRSDVVGELPEQATRLIELAFKNSRRLTHLVNDILDMERISSGRLEFRMEPMEVNGVVDDAIEANAGFAERYGVALRTLRPAAANGVKVAADRSRLIQVLTNLISNAVKFSPPGSAVSVETSTAEGRVRMAVRDAGPGVPDSFRERIFQRFAQADGSDARSSGGTGLGLAISKAIVERHGGAIDFSNQPEGGACFFVDLPLLPAPEAVGRDGQPGLRQLLICEDNADDAELIRATLERADYRVDVASSLSEAQRLLKQRRYIAATLDLTLPDGDGLALARELQRSMPVVVISRRASAAREPHGELPGIVEWLDKPIDTLHLLHALRRAERVTRPGTTPGEEL